MNHVKLSKFLSLVLRHKPEEIGIALDENGWADVDELIRLMNLRGQQLTWELLDEVVETNDKRRFSFNEDATKIRANQGHSIEIDLNLTPQKPPDTLYHGTATRFLDSIRAQGLKPGKRQHVHLSKDQATATKVGQRHGQPVVLIVRAAEMHQAGMDFWCSDNGVWLTHSVATEFIEFPT